MSEEGEIWEEYKKEQDAKKMRRRQVFYDAILPDIIDEAKNCPALDIEKLSPYQYRIKNVQTKKFIDVWTTRTMRGIDGKYYGFGFEETNLIKEIEKLKGIK